MKIKEYKTFSWSKIEEMKITKTQLAKYMGINCSYDTALPHEWLQTFVKKHNLEYHKVIFSTFMVYEGDYFGTPYSGEIEIQQALNKDKIEWIKDVLADNAAQEIVDSLKHLCGSSTSKELQGKLSDGIINILK